jgi:hypothetical protein
MDPYIERRALWADFHDRLVIHVQGLLQPLLKPKYVAIVQDRLYLAEVERAVLPDVSVVTTRKRPVRQPVPGSLAVAEAAPDPAKEYALQREEVREPYLTIVEPAARDRVVTSIEVLSPKNKGRDIGRRAYKTKRRDLWEGGSNFVEVDLLRAGRATADATDAELEDQGPYHYLVVVTRQHPPRRAIYATTVRQRLPRVAIPLLRDDPDVTLDLQAAFSRTWDGGPYPEVLDYDRPPPGKMSADDVAWCEQLLVEKGFR